MAAIHRDGFKRDAVRPALREDHRLLHRPGRARRRNGMDRLNEDAALAKCRTRRAPPDCGGRRLCPSGGDQTHLFQLQNHLMRAMIHLDTFGVQAQLGCDGCLIGV